MINPKLMKNIKFLIFTCLFINCRSRQNIIPNKEQFCETIKVVIEHKNEMYKHEYNFNYLFTAIFYKDKLIIIPIGQNADINDYLSLVKKSPIGYILCDNFSFLIENQKPKTITLKNFESFSEYSEKKVVDLKKINIERKKYNSKRSDNPPPPPPPIRDYFYYIFKLNQSKFILEEMSANCPTYLEEYFSY
jgi:hypothetical protein